MEGDDLGQVRKIALALPGVSERVSHGEPCFLLQDKRPLCYVTGPLNRFRRAGICSVT